MRVNNAPPIGGMLIGYYLICPRKAWLSLRGIWMEQESEAVALGRLLDAHSYTRAQKHVHVEAQAPDGTPLTGKIDWADVKGGVLHETKKGRACEDAHRWQLRFYLWLLRLNGVARPGGEPLTGQLNYPALRRTEAVILTAADEQFLTQVVGEIRQLSARLHPPERITRRSFCRKCAFEELCYG